MNLLLNGCSFMDNYYYKQHFDQLLGANTVNIARAGSSNRRIIRTTVERIEQSCVDFVILGLTFYDRQESPLIEREDPWVSYNSQGMQAQFASANDFSSTAEHKLVDDYVKSRYRYDINHHYLDQLYLDIKMLTAYLNLHQIGYCIFNTCEKHHRTDVSFDYGVIPFDFVGNEFLVNNGAVCMESDKHLPKNARHHYGEDVIILAEHLVKYINVGF